MDADGTKAGFDNALNAAVSDVVSIPVIASGGAGTMEHMRDAFTKGHADAALAASIFHFREIDIMDLKHYLHDQNIPVRL
jgi:cyclase